MSYRDTYEKWLNSPALSAEEKAELEAMDILCEPVRMDEFSNRKFTFFQDPDGLPLELHE